MDILNILTMSDHMAKLEIYPTLSKQRKKSILDTKRKLFLFISIVVLITEFSMHDRWIYLKMVLSISQYLANQANRS